MQKQWYSLLFLFLSVASQHIVAQNYAAQFDKYIANNDTLHMGQLINEWQLSSPQDPELYTAKFNYYYIKSLSEEVVISKEPQANSNFVLKDSLGNDAGYMGSQLRMDKDYLSRCYTVINEGIALYPDRLDMRFGKIYLLGEQENWQPFTEEVIETVRRSGANGNNWKWINNEDYSKNADDFLSSIQNYQLALYHTEDKRLLDNMEQIAKEVLLIYPNSVMNISNLAIAHIARNEYDEAIKLLRQASVIDPSDYIILSNLARCYELNGDKANAILWYKKVESSSEADMQQFAKQKIKELRK